MRRDNIHPSVRPSNHPCPSMDHDRSNFLLYAIIQYVHVICMYAHIQSYTHILYMIDPWRVQAPKQMVLARQLQTAAAASQRRTAVKNSEFRRRNADWTWLSNVAAFTIHEAAIIYIYIYIYIYTQTDIYYIYIWFPSWSSEKYNSRTHTHTHTQDLWQSFKDAAWITRAQSLRGSTPSQTCWHRGSKVSKPRFLNSVTLSQIDWSRPGFPCVMLALAHATFQASKNAGTDPGVQPAGIGMLEGTSWTANLHKSVTLW